MKRYRGVFGSVGRIGEPGIEVSAMSQAGQPDSAAPAPSWDAEADLVVVGCGGAGLATAIRAADLGASVIVLEKEAPESHRPSSREARMVMHVSDVDLATEYFDRCAGGMIPRSVSRAWAERAHALPGWLAEVIGFRMEPVRGAQQKDFAGAEAIHVAMPVPADSAVRVDPRPDPYGVPLAGDARPVHGELFDALLAAAQARPAVRIMWGAPATRLIQQGDRRVRGVVTPGATVGARAGVVLTCGGYEFDEELKLNYLKGYPVHFYGSPSSTGDGIRLAQSAGADLWHMNQMIGRAIGHFTLEDGRPVNAIVRLDPTGYVITDKRGSRFADEEAQARIIEHTFYYELVNFDRQTRDYPRIPCYWFMDQRRIDAGPLAGATGAFDYSWSEDNQAELARGWISRGDTIADAARAAGVLDPEAAQRSVVEYNQACATGSDPFGRPAESLVPLDAPPFYCMPLYPGGPNTCGGPRRDDRSRVLDPFGDPIPGLFAAGELGEPFGLLYPSSGSNMSEAYSFGQIAAETALAPVR
jgi:succinate dehydrogenase/fumarate reductase flavoprotein subunit